MAVSFFGSSPSPSVSDSTTSTGPDPADTGSAACTSTDSTGAASTVSAATSTGGERVGPVAGAASRPAKTKARTFSLVVAPMIVDNSSVVIWSIRPSAASRSGTVVIIAYCAGTSA